MPFAVILAIALAIAALLPLYVERTMLHVMFAHGKGGTVEWGWKRCTLRNYVADYPHLYREQDPALWLTVDIALAVAYASVIAIPLRLATRTRS
ncbi:MAG: hypothetical protein QOJ87_2112 [Verrucomicrobiota bacterium]